MVVSLLCCWRRTFYFILFFTGLGFTRLWDLLRSGFLFVLVSVGFRYKRTYLHRNLLRKAPGIRKYISPFWCPQIPDSFYMDRPNPNECCLEDFFIECHDRRFTRYLPSSMQIKYYYSLPLRSEPRNFLFLVVVCYLCVWRAISIGVFSQIFSY